MNTDELKDRILDATLQAYKDKGLKFTLDDIAAMISISKKTIYKVFKDKDDLFIAMVDRIFAGIKESERRVLEDESLSTMEKLKKLMAVMPDNYQDIDFTQLYLLKDKYPNIYLRVSQYLENGWEETIALLNKGMDEGVFKRISIPIFKLTFSATIEQFFSRDILMENNISYCDALAQVTELLISGIVK